MICLSLHIDNTFSITVPAVALENFLQSFKVPYKTDSPWFSPQISNAIHNRDKAWSKPRPSGIHEDLLTFR